MSGFSKFNTAVSNQLDSMVKSPLFSVNVSKDDIWDAYLASFPEGTNPMFKERTEHDCNCCKGFVTTLGKAVTVTNGKLSSIWDITVNNQYQAVADAMSKFVKEADIEGRFLHYQSRVGRLQTNSLSSGNIVTTYGHFEYQLPSRAYASSGDLPTILGAAQSNYQVLSRSVNEITREAIDIVIDLILQGSLYRGSEHLNIVRSLSDMESKVRKIKPPSEVKNYLWEMSTELKDRSKIRNTVIGTLLVDLSEGVPLERAVNSFEAKVAPENYKRSTALVTEGMIKKAKDQVIALGLEDALDRRYAVVEDVSINNVLFADRETSPLMKDVFDELIPTKPVNHSLDKVETVSVKTFIDDILPNTNSLSLLLNNKHVNNLVSLIAPVNLGAPNLFKWDNGFSWSYKGEVTDSIKERVKLAGGSVSGFMRVSLAWFNKDDLDISVVEPDTKGSGVFFGNRTNHVTGCSLDVDMNVSASTSSTSAVENITWPEKSRMKTGLYQVYVNNYQKRCSGDIGFDLQFEYDGVVHNFHYEKAVGNKEKVLALVIRVSSKGMTFESSLEEGTQANEVWGISTEQYQKVSMVMRSPNFWDSQSIGNQHLFFMLENCKNPEKSRGFYNEFLKQEMNDNRKVFELLGGKMKTPESDSQLSGLGFSSTKRSDILCKVSGKFKRLIRIKF